MTPLEQIVVVACVLLTTHTLVGIGCLLSGRAWGERIAMEFWDRQRKEEERNLDYPEAQDAAMAAVLRIQADNCANMVADPKGDHPSCKPRIGTRLCGRCGRDVTENRGACPAIPPSKRWRFRY